MRYFFVGLVNLLKLFWAALRLPLRVGAARRGPEYVRYRLSGDPPYRRARRRGLRLFRKPDPADVPSIETLRRQFEKLAADPVVRGVILEVDGLEVTSAKREALVGLFDVLRRAGKEIVGYGSSVSNAEYELLSAADR